ncbi:MAG: aldo/keto reductase [Anaerolineales bacterium]
MKTYQLFNGAQIPALGLGTWRMGGSTTPDPSQDDEVRRALRLALEIGYRHFDTAEMYAGGHAETLLGAALRESGLPCEQLFITTKVWHTHLRRADVQRACENSLRRLQCDYVDLYLIHWPAEDVPLEETFEALNTLVRQGKVRALGVSNFDLISLRRAAVLSETPLVTNQVPYSLRRRDYLHNGVLAFCQQQGILLTAYTPLEKGRLAYEPAVARIAQAHGCTPSQVALAWLLHQEGVLAIPKATRPAHLRENFQAADLRLNPQDLLQLDSLA